MEHLGDTSATSKHAFFFCGKNHFGSLGQAPGTPAEPTPTPMPPAPGMQFGESMMGYLQKSAKTTIGPPEN